MRQPITRVVRSDHPGRTISTSVPASLRPNLRKFSCNGRYVQIIYSWVATMEELYFKIVSYF